ncbi:maltose alpha-D-glucosyltransferase [bacterium]|nr:maltose alpha-D-glucosyltransferase [bacterium]
MSPLRKDDIHLTNDPLWFKDAIIYELHVRAFQDSDGNGIGDFQGLKQRLDYIQDLGVNTLWLLPFYPSPLRDDGYDIAYYNAVNPSYGKLSDFKACLREAHKRGLRVITELVLNHTSDQHPWFQRARKAKPGGKWRDFYVWSDDPEKYKETRIIFQDYESSNWTWDPVAGAYYWHRFFSHQPDLNFESPHVKNAVLQILKFWLDMGVDGLRLDAVPYLFEREGTNCENLPETHEYLKELRSYIDERYKNTMLLAEANQWPEDAVSYFGEGDECHMAFHFPVMPRLFMSVQMENRFPIIDILEQTPDIPENCQWAVFLRNHDELTLEMVTDEERDYMNRTYAHDPRARINLGIRHRLAPLMKNNRRKIELMNGLLFSLPGTPVIYYGDEIGMGDNIYLGDRNSVRTPMQWSSDRNAGFSRSNPQQLYLPVVIDPEYHYEAINVEAQRENPNSLFWWMKKLIAIRNRYQSFGRGQTEFLHPDNNKVLVFIRRYQDEEILVVANLSRYLQYVELDLADYKGRVPEEVSSRQDFPPIGELPYFLTLGPYAFYWFLLKPKAEEGGMGDGYASPEALPEIAVREKWEGVFTARYRKQMEKNLIPFIRSRRWFGGKARRIKSVDITDTAKIPHEETTFVLFVTVEFTEGDPQTYLIPLSYAKGQWAEDLRNYHLSSVLLNLRIKKTDEVNVIYDAFLDQGFCVTLLDMMSKRRKVKSQHGTLQFHSNRMLRRLAPKDVSEMEASVSRAEQSNTSIVYEDNFIFKLYRKLEAGVNPDYEISEYLTEKEFANTPPVAGALLYHPKSKKQEDVTLGLLQGFVTNEGDAWHYTLDSLGRFLEQIQSMEEEAPKSAFSITSMLNLVEEDPSYAYEKIGPYLESAYLLGQRTAEMHKTLASNHSQKDFAPQDFTQLYQRSLYQSQRTLTTQIFQTLRRQQKRLPEGMREEAKAILSYKEPILKKFRSLLKRKIKATRIRTHGDYHLGQVLYTGKDFVIIDFEGEPARPLGERRLKRSPLRDVAGMLRSFHYAAYSALFEREANGMLSPEEYKKMEAWIRFWHEWVSVIYFAGYKQTAEGQAFLPKDREELRTLLECYLLEKSVYELGYEMNNRPEWLKIPFQGILQLVQDEQE